MNIEEVLESQLVINKNLLSRVKELEGKLNAETAFITESLTFAVATVLARNFPEAREYIIAHCEAIKPPDNINGEAVAAGFNLLADYFRDPDKKIMPKWFGGVISGGKEPEKPKKPEE